jgi:hypothetical protein
MGKLQARANPCNTGIISRNEMRKAVRVRSSAFSFSCNPVIRRCLSAPTLSRLAGERKAC